MIQAIKTAFSNMLKEPYTHAYPAAPISKPKQYRGLIKYNKEHCIFCDKCEKVCPPGAILFKHFTDGTKEYLYNPHLCIYCGDCVSDCPKTGEALWQSEEKSMPAVLKDMPNDNWLEIEKEVAVSKEEVKAYKVAQKQEKLKVAQQAKKEVSNKE